MSSSDQYDLPFEIEGRVISTEKESILNDPSMIGMGMVGIGIAIGIFALVNQPPPPNHNMREGIKQ